MSGTYINQEMHNSPGATQNILTDKESLGIRQENALYQHNKKVGQVIGFAASATDMTFTIAEIRFDQPMASEADIWEPYELQNYVIWIRQVTTLTTSFPAGATGVSGIVLSQDRDSGDRIRESN